jgi:hypothetical protein
LRVPRDFICIRAAIAFARCRCEYHLRMSNGQERSHLSNSCCRSL